jgi:hypothetical protein
MVHSLRIIPVHLLKGEIDCTQKARVGSPPALFI